MSETEPHFGDTASPKLSDDEMLAYVEKLLASLRAMLIKRGKTRLAHQISLAEIEAAYSRKEKAGG